MSSFNRPPNSSSGISANKLRVSHVGKQATTKIQTTPTRQPTHFKPRELSAPEKAIRATNSPCAIHAARRAGMSHPAAAPRTANLTKPPCEVLAPVEVPKPSNIGISSTTRRKSRRSTRASLEEAFYECHDNSVGFLTPSLNQSHSDPSCWGDDDPLDKRTWFFCCHIPRVHLSQRRSSPCLWSPVSKNKPGVVDTRVPITLNHRLVGDEHKKPPAIVNGEVKSSIGKAKSTPVLSVAQDSKVGPLERIDAISTTSRSKLSGPRRGNGIILSIPSKRSRQGNMMFQAELPTIVTLRRAIAVLNTLAQPRIHGFSAGLSNSTMLREYRRSIRSMASPAEYLITSEEIRGLTNLLQKRFIAPIPQRSAVVKKKPSLIGLAWRRRVKKASSGSVIWFGGPRKNLNARALSASDVQTVSGSMQGHVRRGHFMSHITQRTSIISMMMSGKSVHEMIWEDDGKPQSLFSSSWSLANHLAQTDLATWSNKSYTRALDPRSINYTGRATLDEPTIMGIKRERTAFAVRPGFNTVWEDPAEKTWESSYDIEKSLSLSDVRIPSYVTQQFSICTPKPISEGVWLPPISSLTKPLLGISANDLGPSLLDPGAPESIWRESSCALAQTNIVVESKLSMVSVSPSKTLSTFASPSATMPRPKASLWGRSTTGLAKVPLASTPKVSLWSSDVAASGQMAMTRLGRVSAIADTPRLWKRRSASRLRSALKIGSSERLKSASTLQHMCSVETIAETAKSKAPWGSGALDSVSISSRDLGSDRSSMRDADSLREGRRLLNRISKRAGNRQDRWTDRNESKGNAAETYDQKYNSEKTGNDFATENMATEQNTLEEKSKYEKMDEWVKGLAEAIPALELSSGENRLGSYAYSRIADRKTGDEGSLKLAGVARRSVSITTIG